MRIVFIGSNGQLGKAFQAAHREYAQEVTSNRDEKMELIPVDVPEWDITDPQQVDRLASLEPDVVIHSAAMTNVDGCARDPDSAFRVNAFGTQNVALACLKTGAAMVYISTNEVFDGTSDTPYREFDPTRAINPYAASKLAGEKITSQLLQRLYIVRISWLFSPEGNNFVSKILTRAKEQGMLKVVTDEVANPTYAPDLATALLNLIQTDHYGIYHLVNEGYCSRYVFSEEIMKQAGRQDVPLYPITRHDFERASTPPAFAPLHNFFGAALGIRLRPWQEALTDYFRQAGQA